MFGDMWYLIFHVHPGIKVHIIHGGRLRQLKLGPPDLLLYFYFLAKRRKAYITHPLQEQPYKTKRLHTSP
jgi:hypothetical protein